MKEGMARMAGGPSDSCSRYSVLKTGNQDAFHFLPSSHSTAMTSGGVGGGSRQETRMEGDPPPFLLPLEKCEKEKEDARWPQGSTRD